MSGDTKKTKKNSNRRTKRKSTKKKNSKIQKTWEKFVQQSDCRSLLKDVWKADNFQKEYSAKINQLHKKYSNS